MGHIPINQIKNINIISFDDALNNYNNCNCSMDKSKWIYMPDTYNEYRYILGTVGNNPLITIGINPSTAEPEKLDNTLKSVERIAHNNNFDSFVMFNISAQRSTNPDDMDNEISEQLHTQNCRAFSWFLSNLKLKPVIWAAWGTLIDKRTYLKTYLDDIVTLGYIYDANWVTTGKLSKYGHPHHPLYLPKDSKFREFDIAEYMKNIMK